MTDVILRNRDIDDGKVSPDRFGKPLVYGEIQFVAWVSASNPTDEVLDQSTAQLVAHQALGVTQNLTNGTQEILRDGRYRLRFNAFTVSAASASGVMEFFIQKNSAALTQACSCKLLQPAVAANFMSTGCEQVVALAKGDLIRIVVTGTTGGIITIAKGNFTVEMLSDATAYTPV